MNEKWDLAFGVRFDSFEFGGSFFHPLSLSLSLDYFQYYFSGCSELKGITRFPFYIFSLFFFFFCWQSKDRQGWEGGRENLSQVSEVSPGQFRAQQSPFLFVLFPPVSSPVSSSFDILPLPLLPPVGPVNYTLSNFAFIRGLLIHKLPRTVTVGAEGRRRRRLGTTNRLLPPIVPPAILHVCRSRPECFTWKLDEIHDTVHPSWRMQRVVCDLARNRSPSIGDWNIFVYIGDGENGSPVSSGKINRVTSSSVMNHHPLFRFHRRLFSFDSFL